MKLAFFLKLELSNLFRKLVWWREFTQFVQDIKKRSRTFCVAYLRRSFRGCGKTTSCSVSDRELPSPAKSKANTAPSKPCFSSSSSTSSRVSSGSSSSTTSPIELDCDSCTSCRFLFVTCTFAILSLCLSFLCFTLLVFLFGSSSLSKFLVVISRRKWNGLLSSSKMKLRFLSSVHYKISNSK